MIVSSAEIARIFDEIRDQRDAALARAEASEAYIECVRVALGGYPDSDLVSLAETLNVRNGALEAKDEGMSSLLGALKGMSDKYDRMFYPRVRYWEAARWIKAAQQGATFSVADRDGAKILVWDKEGV